jgi:hypothetical protein
MKVLVIFDMLPEETVLAIVNPSDEEMKTLKLAAGGLINSDSPEEVENAVDQVSRWLDGKWKENRIPIDKMTGPVDSAVWMGFIM